MTRAFIGLGSNLGDRAQNISVAIEWMRRGGIEVIRVSSLYETDPVGPPQPDYLNAACEAETELSAQDLKTELQAVEDRMGRERGERWGPRLIDLDLLLFGDGSIEEDDLTVPHPELTNRAFVLVPLLEIAPRLDLPSGEPLSAFCEDDPAGVRLFGALPSDTP